MTSLKEGDKAPFFKGINQDGKEITSEDFKGKKLVLYFYPKDNTSGCTAEACSLNDNYDTLTAQGMKWSGLARTPPFTPKVHRQIQFSFQSDSRYG